MVVLCEHVSCAGENQCDRVAEDVRHSPCIFAAVPAHPKLRVMGPVCTFMFWFVKMRNALCGNS